MNIAAVPHAELTRTADRMMRYYMRLAQIDGRTQETDYQRFYGFKAHNVISLHASRLVDGRIEQGLWFRIGKFIVVDALTGKRLSAGQSAPELFDISVN